MTFGKNCTSEVLVVQFVLEHRNNSPIVVSENNTVKIQHFHGLSENLISIGGQKITSNPMVTSGKCFSFTILKIFRSILMEFIVQFYYTISVLILPKYVLRCCWLRIFQFSKNSISQFVEEVKNVQIAVLQRNASRTGSEVTSQHIISKCEDGGGRPLNCSHNRDEHE
jgi:hypothetical protein